MKTNSLLLLIILLAFPTVALGQTKRQQKKADEQTTQWRYEIESAGIATQGSQTVKVWSYSKNPIVAAEQSKKNAVHGLLFKGVSAKEGAPEKKPLVSAQEKAGHQDFFDSFFANGGNYMMYVTQTSPENDLIKISNKEYKVGVYVTVKYDDLRKLLEKEGIIKKLTNGF